MDNEWRPLDSLGFSMYEANPSGNIRNKETKRILQRKPHKCRYVKLCMKHDDGTYKNVKADGLICTIFVGPRPHNAEVIHINGDTLDSRAENLEWGTAAEKKQVDIGLYANPEYIRAVTLPNEEWRDCSPYGYVDYLASSLGRIYSMRTGKVLSGHIRADGYAQVNISVGGTNKEVLTHILVCHAFHGHRPDETYSVDHIDRNKLNNVPFNLRWASKSEQVLNRDGWEVRKFLIAQVHDDKIVDFHDEQAILEIFNLDEVIIPPEGVYLMGNLWIYETFINLDMINEIWSPVQIGDTVRMISNMGRVQMGTRKTFGITRIDGYKSVVIDGQSFLVHRLVITSFKGEIVPDLVVNHIDRDRANNRLDNLEIVTKAENTIHAIRSGHKTLKPVQQIATDGTVIATFPSIQAASDATGIYHSNISAAATGTNKTSGGFIWRFIV